MKDPVFDEIADTSCACPACAAERRRQGHALRSGGNPARRARRTAASVVIAGFVAAGVTPATAHAIDADQTLDDQGQPRQPADSRPHDHAQPPPEEERDDGSDAAPYSADEQGPDGTPQGPPGPLSFGSGDDETASGAELRGATTRSTITRAQVLQRAQAWVNAGVPYSQTAYNGGYRQDCSGFVAMAWALGKNAWTGDLATYGTKIAKSDLQAGDILLFHNAANPSEGSHVIIFEKWADTARTKYVGYEQTPPGTQHRTIPYAYFTYATSYTPYRYKNISDSGSTAAAPAFPGTQYFGPGKSNAYITQLGEALVAKGYGGYYTKGPGPTWSAADQQATAAFQRAQGWTGANADGIPGPQTWSRLMS